MKPMLTESSHTIVKLSDEMLPFTHLQTGCISNQKTLKETRRPIRQALKFDVTHRQVMPKQILFTGPCFYPIVFQQVLGAWVEARTVGHGSEIEEKTWAQMAGDSHDGRWRGVLCPCAKGRHRDSRRDQFPWLSLEPTKLAAIGCANPFEWANLWFERRSRQSFVQRGHCPSGARNPLNHPQRKRPPQADDTRLPLSPQRTAVVVCVEFFV